MIVYGVPGTLLSQCLSFALPFAYGHRGGFSSTRITSEILLSVSST